MSEMVLGYYTPFNLKIHVHVYREWRSLWADFNSFYSYGGSDGTMNFWVVYEGYIYYGNSPVQLDRIKKILAYRNFCEDL